MSSRGPRTKREFYRGWLDLRFGNRIRMWPSQAALAEACFGGTVTARSQGGKAGGGACHYRVPATEAASDPRYAGMAFNESAPDEELLYQGEYSHGAVVGGHYLFGSAVKLPMRQALALHAQEKTGLDALGTLLHYCNAKSFDMMAELVELYPQAVIEFGAYGRCLGVIPGHNTVIWEIREY